MGSKRKNPSQTDPVKRIRPAINRESRENQLIALAENVAEEQLLNGTASSQVITHYLKLGTMREKLERDNLREQNELLKAKVEALKSAKKMEELYTEAIEVFKRYGGHFEEEEVEIIDE